MSQINTINHSCKSQYNRTIFTYNWSEHVVSFSEVFLAFTAACHIFLTSGDWNALLIMYLASQKHLDCSCLSCELVHTRSFTQGIYHPLLPLPKACFSHAVLSSASVEQKDFPVPWCTIGFPLMTQKLTKRLLQSLLIFSPPKSYEKNKNKKSKQEAKHQGQGYFCNQKYLVLSEGACLLRSGTGPALLNICIYHKETKLLSGEHNSKLSLEIPKQMSHELQCLEARERI